MFSRPPTVGAFPHSHAKRDMKLAVVPRAG